MFYIQVSIFLMLLEVLIMLHLKCCTNIMVLKLMYGVLALFYTSYCVESLPFGQVLQRHKVQYAECINFITRVLMAVDVFLLHVHDFCRNRLWYFQTNFKRKNRFWIWSVAADFRKCERFNTKDAWKKPKRKNNCVWSLM